MHYFKSLTLCTALLVLACSSFAKAQDNPEVLITEGEFFGEVRYRYENVDQANIAENANAHTIRTNIGFKTGQFKGFHGLIEGQLVHHVGDDDFNSLENGNTTFPVVADPNVTQINRAYIAYTGIPSTEITLGRHGINLDNQRFVGTVGWRQNDQTFDAVTLTNKSIDNLSLRYSYIDDVNRIFGDDAPPENLESNSHIINVNYAHADWLNATGYGYLMDFDNAAALSNSTYGARLTGKAPINENWTVGYVAELATQSDYGNNPADYEEQYYHIAPSLSGHGVTLKAGYEVLGGDGTNAFQTPLATLHKFNGWADTFLTTSANGLKDAYLKASYKASGVNKLVDGTKFTAAYHDFSGEESGDFGSEINVSVGKSFTLPASGYPFKKVNVSVKFADYNADDAPYNDTQKIWLQIGTKF